jgi:hypothetical protein
MKTKFVTLDDKEFDSRMIAVEHEDQIMQELFATTGLGDFLDTLIDAQVRGTAERTIRQLLTWAVETSRKVQVSPVEPVRITTSLPDPAPFPMPKSISPELWRDTTAPY